MTPELPEVGSLVSASLAAHEIDAISVPDRHATETHGNCLNCGAPLSDAYCSRCGQPSHLHRSLLHLSEEFLHGVLHFDAKGFRTMPLLFFRPGVLTRRYIEGQRTRYVSPMALFLFCIFLMYFVFSLVVGEGGPKLNVGSKAADPATAKAEVEKSLAEAQEELTKASAELDAARKAGVGVQAAERAFAAATLGQQIATLSLSAANSALAKSDKSDRPDKSTSTPVSQSADQAASAPKPDDVLVVASADSLKTFMTELSKAIPDVPGWKGRLRRSLANPDLLFYKLKSTAYKYSFLLIPISLPFLRMMFAWRRGVTMYDHAIFSLYSLSFMSLLFTLMALIGAAGLEFPIAACVTLIPPVHMFVQLRGTYQLSIFSALWRTVALLFICGTAFSLFMLFIVAMLFH
jgi:hypothetical protein